MSTSDHSADAVIEEYAADLATWEDRLQTIEEQAKGLSVEDHSDRHELVTTAQEILPDIADQYKQVKQSQDDVAQLERKLAHTLNNPELRYEDVPASLDRQKKMKTEIEDLHEEFYRTEERQDYISYELEEEFNISIDDHLYSTRLHQYADRMLDGKYGSQAKKALSKPENAFIAGMFTAGVGAVALDYLQRRQDR